MPPRSAVLLLPEDVKKELDQLLISGGFSNYEGLSEWLAGQDIQISKSALHRYGQDFEEKLGRLKLANEQVRAIVQASPDEEGAFNDAVQRLAQERLFHFLTDMNLDPRDEKRAGSFLKAVHAIADLGRATVTQKQWASKIKTQLDQKLRALEQQAKAGKAGLDPATLKRVREEIYGIV